MSIVTISRGSYSRGKEVAEALAKRLGYECVSRDILLETCKEFSIPEIRLVKALHDAPSVLDRFNHGRERYIAYFRAAFLNHMVKDNIVYHGLAGHFFLMNIAHVFKVRIISNLENRVKEEMKRENCSAEQARYTLKKDDEERRRWSLHLYGQDTWNCSLYDLVLHVDTLTVEDVVDILEQTIRKGRFNASPESLAILKAQAQQANIHAMVINYSPAVQVSIQDDVVTLANVDGNLKSDTSLRETISAKIKDTYHVKDVVFAKAIQAKKDHINPFYNLDVK